MAKEARLIMADTPLASGSNIIHIIWAKKSKILSEDFLKNGGSAKDQTKKNQQSVSKEFGNGDDI
jgi:hypothetical protein